MKRKFGYLASAVLVAFACNASAQASGSDPVAGRIASNFTRLAGSQENALALVKALRTGETVQLTYAPTGTATTPTIATIDPATGAMGWGNVKVALGLAQDQLRRLGITNPTPEQLQAALNGGDVTVTAADGTRTTTTLRGVLQMRADGMGWGQIAQAGGTKVGPVVSALKMGNNKAATGTTTTAAGATAAATGKGITTAAGASSARGSNSAKGLTTAAGVAASASSHGLTTAQGAASANHGNAYGRGIVTATGGAPAGTVAATPGKPAGVGVVSGSGNAAASVASANGNAGGNGRGNGADHGQGKAKGA